MTGVVLRLCAVVTLAGVSTGCGALDLGPWGGPTYTLDPAKVGTGQQAITPRNDWSYSRGEPMDYRSRR